MRAQALLGAVGCRGQVPCLRGRGSQSSCTATVQRAEQCVIKCYTYFKATEELGSPEKAPWMTGLHAGPGRNKDR